MLFLLSSCFYSYSDLEEEKEKLNEEWSSDYSELEEKYYEALEREEHLSDKIWSFEDDSITVWCYFEGENDVTFDEAYDAYQRIITLWTY